MLNKICLSFLLRFPDIELYRYYTYLEQLNCFIRMFLSMKKRSSHQARKITLRVFCLQGRYQATTSFELFIEKIMGKKIYDLPLTLLVVSAKIRITECSVLLHGFDCCPSIEFQEKRRFISLNSRCNVSLQATNVAEAYPRQPQAKLHLQRRFTCIFST